MTPTWCPSPPVSPCARKRPASAPSRPPPPATRKPRCCRPWKAPARWSTTKRAARAMSDKGLGTPATRAAIIEGLITEKYMYRDGRELIPTAKAFQLMTLLRGLGVEDPDQAPS